MTKDSSNSEQMVTLGDANEVEKVFQKFDANSDGKISLSELGAILDALGSNTSEDDLQRVISEIDADGDGLIDLKEFTEFHRGGSDERSKQLRDAFDLYDKDKNGVISASELHEVLKSLGEICSLNDCNRMISTVDVDGDGNVNFEEFEKMMTSA